MNPQTIRNPIIPSEQIFTGQVGTYDTKAICVFAAIGFFIDCDTYYKGLKIISPGSEYSKSGDENIQGQKYFNWHYDPIERSLKQVTEEFTALFETIINEQTEHRKVILPLSGGLDSRTQAAALRYLKKDVNAYSYEYAQGIPETSFALKIADRCNFPFTSWEIPEGYLMKEVEKIGKLNGCYSEFTHPRQYAFLDRFKSMGNLFSLGHWGDVLFDNMGINGEISFEEQVDWLIKKLLKKGGLEFAESLWASWGHPGSFITYFTEKVSSLLAEIKIGDANARIRAFKSLHWAPRWTSVNLSVFKAAHPIALPYYDNRMCEFICSVPENYLSGRKIQIEYLKLRMPELARIPWQDHRPFNLYNYSLDRFPWNLPFRILDKIKRMLRNEPFVLRNWEIQFLGKENRQLLENWLVKEPFLKGFIPDEIPNRYLKQFYSADSLMNSHPVSMLLTLSVFRKAEQSPVA